MKKISLFAIIPIVILIICLIATLLIYGVHRRQEKVVQAMDNPYISSDYIGWKEICLEENSAIKIPDEWEIILNDDQITIICANKTIAKGIRVKWDVYNSQGGAFEAISSFDQETFSFAGENTDVIMLNPIHSGMAAEYYLKVTSDGNDRSETHYRVSFSRDHLYYYLFDFGKKEEIDKDSKQIIEAIAFSFHYK